MPDDAAGPKGVRTRRPRRPRLTPLQTFARNFFRHPRMLGACLPSSRFLVQRVLRPIDWSRARVVVEYGPGVGTLTAEMLRLMHPDARLLAFETNPEFVAFLKEALPDPRLHVINASAEEVDRQLAELGHDGADWIVSGIPFTYIPAPARDAILRASRAVLRDDGGMIVYQFSPTILGPLKRNFGEVRVHFEPRNLLPALIFRCSTGDGSGNGA